MNRLALPPPTAGRTAALALQRHHCHIALLIYRATSQEELSRSDSAAAGGGVGSWLEAHCPAGPSRDVLREFTYTPWLQPEDV